MSQEKVAKYKEVKANRKALIKKEKRMKWIRVGVASAVGVVILGWIGVSGVNKIVDSIPRESVVVDYKAISDYQDALTEEETQEDVKEETEEETKETTEEATE